MATIDNIAQLLMQQEALDRKMMPSEPEALVPVRCPICMRESLAGFRISVIADALESGEIRLYADCHVVSWDAGQRELERIREYLDAMWTANPQEVRREMCDLDGASDEADREIILEGDLELAKGTAAPV